MNESGNGPVGFNTRKMRVPRLYSPACFKEFLRSKERPDSFSTKAIRIHIRKSVPNGQRSLSKKSEDNLKLERNDFFDKY